MGKIKNILRGNIISVLLILVGILMIWGCFLIINNKKIIENTLAVKEAAEEIKFQLDAHLDVVRELDVSLRGFALTKEERYLYIKPKELRQKMYNTFERMDSLLDAQGFRDEEALKVLYEYQSAIKVLLDDQATMVNYLRDDKDKAFMNLFLMDKGNDLAPLIAATDELINGYQNELSNQAEANYNEAMQNNIVVQIVMVILGIPAIALVLFRIRSDGRKRKNLIKELAENNRKYLFDSGKASKEFKIEKVIEQSIKQMQKASDFISKMSDGELDVKWDGLNNENKELNKGSLAGRLAVMQEKLVEIRRKDNERNWTNEGLSKLGEVLRQYQDLGQLTDTILVQTVQYIGANQGALFLVDKSKESDKEYLELKSSYAYDRKKFREQKFLPGQTLAGQAWIEREKIILKEIPSDYVRITSGLGEATPRYVIILPLKFDEKIIGILELASFDELPAYKVEFLERLSESMASTFITLKMNEQTTNLLIETQQNAEERQAQEEEMRQNMEELEATQEEMRRKEQQFIEEIERLKTQNNG